MAKPLSVLFVSSEVYPFSKETGMADVSYSLPLALRELGHDIRVMMPKYGAVSERKNKIHEINRLRDIPIPVGDIEEPVTVKSSSINNPRVKVQAYISTNHKYFDSKKGIYLDPDTWKEYPDNAERFIFFNRCVIETCLLLGWYPDIIHCNDWQTSLIPAYVHVLFPHKFKKTKVITTVHYFNRQGVFPLAIFNKTGLPEDALEGFKFKNKLNFLKGGLTYSDYITTISKTYAEDFLKDKAISNGINEIVKERLDRFSGIRNGIDAWSWKPASDPFIMAKYNGKFSEFKSVNKSFLLKKFQFDSNLAIPLIGITPRIDINEGIPLLLEALKELLNENVRIILLGDGDPALKQKIEKLAQKHPDKFAAAFEFDEFLAHQIFAGCDLLLNISLYEPSGLHLMYALAYGAIPVAYLAGGMKDFLTGYDNQTKTGNSFVYENYNVADLLAALKNAFELYNDTKAWEALATRCIAVDLSWNDSAKLYDEIYRMLIKD